jgi:flagellar assembly protein FliH
MKSQPNYRTPPFERAIYEDYGQRPKKPLFEPLKIDIVAHEGRGVDPMFADYGVKSSEGEARYRRPADGDRQTANDTPPEERLSLTLADIERIKGEEYQRGFEAGSSVIQESREARIAELQDRTAGLCEDLAGQLHGEVERIERQAVGLAILVSRRIIGEAVDINPEYLLPVVREALGYVGGADVLRVRISPADLEFVELERIRERFDGTWSFVADPAISSGCIIETSSGEVDYRLDAAWERLKEQVLRSVTS